MTTERFTQEQFEAALPAVPFTTQWVKGELVYYIPVFFTRPDGNLPTNKRIVIRSSIDYTGRAADSGNDSIRHWVEYNLNNGLPGGLWKPLSKGGKAWTTRVPGWGARLTEALRELWQIALEDSAKYMKKGVNGNGSVTNTGKGSIDSTNGQQGSVAHSGEQSLLPNDSMPEDVASRVDRENRTERGGTGRDLPVLPGDSGSAPELPDILSFLGEPSTIQLPDDGRDAGSDDGAGVGPDEVEPVAAIGQRPADVRAAAAVRANAAQLEAITSDPRTPLRVLAPPGSGKTFLLSYRYAHLLSCGANPHQIVAVTFNKTMADELLARIARVNPEIQDLLDHSPDDDAVRQVCTIHALCYRMLRSEGDRREVPGGTGRVKVWMVKDALEKIIEDLWPVIQHRPGWKEVMAYIDAAKGHGLDSSHDMTLYDDVRDKYGNLVGMQLHQARRRFDEWQERNRVMQFSDMLFDVDRRLQDDPAFRIRWQTRYKYMLIDEGQDTSAQAMRILTTLAAPQNQITVVGDTDQLLYRFTGATPEANLYEGFEQRYPDGKLVKLEVNYRSTQEIIRRYSQLIENNYGEGRPYDVKYFKHIEARPDAPEGEPVTFQMYYDAVAEAQAVAQQIKQMIDEGRQPSDFFVGARTCAQTGYLEGPLVQAGVPYINLVGTSFWTLKHIADVIAYIRLAFNESDSKAFEQVYNVASNEMVYPWGEHKGEYCNHRFLDKQFIQACYDAETRQPQYKWRWQAASKRRSYSPGVEDLDRLVQELQGILAYDTIADAIEYLVENCYADYLKASEGLTDDDASNNGKLDDIETVKDLSTQFGQDVGAFLDYVNKAVAASEAAQNGDWKDHVVISTFHKLKGLERKVVFCMGLCEGYDRVGNVVGLLPHTYSMRPPSIQGTLPLGGMGRIEDERDVCYVGVSRAMEEVHLTGCSKYRTYTMYPSRFVYEMCLLPIPGNSDIMELEVNENE